MIIPRNHVEHNQQLTKNTEGIQIFSGDHICQSDCKTLFTKSGVLRRTGYPTLYPEELQIFGVVMAFIHKTRGMD